ncbi:hypothetical protein A0H81_08867 [Grifola frondosa]|uniref:Uncharacterized protein n=1 Tax=Grifola frondosa TaxID=5627 RepID=A0A1C7M8G4_GRIFR|nr:hypothetical protein A0H81_08867 [Grifola frondosa]
MQSPPLHEIQAWTLNIDVMSTAEPGYNCTVPTTEASKIPIIGYLCEERARRSAGALFELLQFFESRQYNVLAGLFDLSSKENFVENRVHLMMAEVLGGNKVEDEG